MIGFAKKLASEAYVRVGSPNDKEVFIWLFIISFRRIDDDYFWDTYFIYQCWSYDKLAKNLLDIDDIPLSKNNINRMKTKLRQRVARARKRIICNVIEIFEEI